MTSSTKPYPFPSRFQSLVSLFAAISVVMLILVFSSEIPRAANPGNSQPIKNAKKNSSCCSDEANKLHHLAGSYYTLNNGFKTKLLLNNKGPDPIEIQPILFSLGGERLGVSPVTVAGNSHKFVDLSDWVNAAGDQFREGSIQLVHPGKDLVIGAQLYLTDREHSLSFEEKLTELGTGSPRLEGVWWLPAPQGTVSLVLSNTGDSSLSVMASIRGRAPKLETSANLELGAHETKVVNIERDLINRDRAAMATFGAISLEHNGAPGALVARAMAFDASRGYSLPIQFMDPGSGKSTSLQGAGLRIGRAGSDWLSPKVVVGNVGATETVLTGRINYTTKDGTNGSITLPATRLAPQQVELLDLLPYVSAGVKNRVATAGLEFEYDGQPGSIVTSAFSVSPNGNQVFRIPLWDIKSQRSATGGYPWLIDGDSSTIVYIKNVTDEVREFTLQLRYDGGVYALGLKSINPHQTLAFDIRELRDQQIPDLSGNTLPLSASSGQVSWSMHGKQNLALIGRSEQYDVVHGISSNYACQNCCPDSFLSGWVSPDSLTSSIGDSGWWYAWEQTQNCYGTWQSPFHPSFPNWSGSNFGVCSCDGFGFGFSEGPGSSTISANWSSYTWGSFESGNPNECSSVEESVLADAACEVLFGDVNFTTVTFSNISANFNQFGSATLNVGSANGGTGACTQGASHTFQITVNFDMPSGASSISNPSVGTFVTDNDKQKFSYTSFSFQNVSFSAPPHGQMVIGVFLARPTAPRDVISLRISGRYPNGDSWTGSANVHLVCP